MIEVGMISIVPTTSFIPVIPWCTWGRQRLVIAVIIFSFRKSWSNTYLVCAPICKCRPESPRSCSQPVKLNFPWRWNVLVMRFSKNQRAKFQHSLLFACRKSVICIHSAATANEQHQKKISNNLFLTFLIPWNLLYSKFLLFLLSSNSTLLTLHQNNRDKRGNKWQLSWGLIREG